MIKKLITNTLLSVFMDKKARGALDSYKNIELVKKKLILDTSATKDSLIPLSTSDKIKKNSQKIQTSKNSIDKTHQLIIESLNAAKLEIKAKPKITENRMALINEVKRLQSSKKYILDKLSEEQRQKLKALALSMFKGESSHLKESERKVRNKKKQSL